MAKTLSDYIKLTKRQRIRDLYFNRRREIRKHKIKVIFDMFEIGKYD